jgi:hypothetical protein
MSYVHGTYSGMVQKCPCVRCVEYRKEYSLVVKNKQRKDKGLPPLPVPAFKFYDQPKAPGSKSRHPRQSASANWKRARTELTSNALTSSEGRANRWTAEEDKVLERFDISLTELALLLGRSYSACADRRYRLGIRQRRSKRDLMGS